MKRYERPQRVCKRKVEKVRNTAKVHKRKVEKVLIMKKVDKGIKEILRKLFQGR